MKKIILKKGREKSLLRKHPWVFSNSISDVQGDVVSGDLVDIYDFKNKWLAKGSYSSSSQIRSRIWSFDSSEKIDQQFFLKKLKKAFNLRESIKTNINSNAYRLIAAESDDLPGTIIDIYDNNVVVQLLWAGIERFRKELFASLKTLLPNHHIYERSDANIRKKEELPLTKGLLSQHSDFNSKCVITENGVKINVDIENGHKTGFYIDQRENRNIVSKYVDNKTVLNCFSYTAGFGLFAYKGNAKHITNIDVSNLALDLAKENFILNKYNTKKVDFINKDVFKALREYHNEGKNFDVIILDPPKFMESKKQLNDAARGYKDINRLALSLIKPGGVLFTFSCSGLMPSELFQKIISDSALDAGKEIKIIEKLSQSQDHPISGNFPEGFYLKGLACYVN